MPSGLSTTKRPRRYESRLLSISLGSWRLAGAVGPHDKIKAMTTHGAQVCNWLLESKRVVGNSDASRPQAMSGAISE